ncbi:MAG: hypothetical protein WC833_02210 [Bacteroidales bacterium]|jgi:hypothetical protein
MKQVKFGFVSALRCIAVIFSLVQMSGCEKNIATASIDFVSEQIPGSKNHSPNGTWWGYNQSKIVRYGNVVYMYVIENQNVDSNPNPNATNPSKIVLYRKDSDNSWQKGGSFNTSRPGNILIDSDGIVHLIVFEPTYTLSTENGSYGKLKHYWFPNCKTGDITSSQQETIIDNDGVSQGETVNMRVGASIGKDDVMAVSFGLNKTHRLYYKEKTGVKWIMDYSSPNLGSDIFYPYVIVTDSGFGILAIQDDYVGQNLPNIYQKTYYFEKKNGAWKNEILINLQSHPLAQSRPQLIENSDICQDAAKQIHLLYQTRLNPSDQSQNSFSLSSQLTSGWDNQPVTASDNTNWMRIIEVNGETYYLCSSWDKLYIKKGVAGELKQLKVPKVSGMYIYVSSPRGGTKSAENYVDILLLNGNRDDYPNAKNYYIRIAKSEFAKI